ncbi:MAG: DegT/DnrJ/EryC1/StrS family aminotransferase [Actinomycetota bacterium]
MRMQLPAYSPVEPTALVGALVDMLRGSGGQTSRLSEYLATRFDASKVVLTGSGTQALQLALTATARGDGGLGDNRLVALPAYSCYDVVTAAVGAGVRATFYDIEPATLTPNRESVTEVLRQGAGVVVAGNLYGFPLDWGWLIEECGRVGAVLIEDAAQGLGSGWRGKSSGSFGDYSILSFGRGKGWTAGEGGALLIRGAYDEIHVPSTTRVGISAWAALWGLWLMGRPALYRFPTMVPGLGLGETRYRPPGRIEKMAPLVAALTYQLAATAARNVEIRRAWAVRWTELFAEHKDATRQWALCAPTEEAECGYLRYPGCLRSERERESFLLRGRRYGVASGYPKSLPALPQSRRIVAGHHMDTTGAEVLARTLVTLPTHPRMTEHDLRSLAAKLV